MSLSFCCVIVVCFVSQQSLQIVFSKFKWVGSGFFFLASFQNRFRHFNLFSRTSQVLFQLNISFLILFQFFFFFSPNLLSVFLSTQKHTNVKLSTTKVFSKEWQCLLFFFENIFFCFFLVWKLVEGFGRLPLDGLTTPWLVPFLPQLVGVGDQMILKKNHNYKNDFIIKRRDAFFWTMLSWII